MFCGSCGCRVESADAAAAGALRASAEVSGGAVMPTESAQQQAWQVQTAQQPLQSAQQLDMASMPQPRRSSFAAFLTERRQVGKTLVPTFAIILAAIIAAAGTAYALVKAYEVFVEPVIEQKSENNAAPAKRTKKQSSAEMNKKAHRAYGDVINRYRDFSEYCLQAGQGAGNYELWAKDRDEGDDALAQIFIYDSIVAPAYSDYYYAYKDLDDDGVDELLIGNELVHQDIEEADRILDIYRFVDGKAEPLIEQTEGFGEWGKADYEGFQVQGESQVYELCSDGLVKLGCSQDASASELYLKIKNGEVVIEDALQFSNATSDRQNGGYVIRSISNGGKPKEETASGRDEAMNRMKTLEDKHPVSDFERPGPNSKVWKLLFQASASAGSDDAQPDAASNQPTDTDDSEDEHSDKSITDEASFIATAKRELFVPDDANTTYEISDEPFYWDGTGIWLWDVAFYRDGKFVAGADCDSDGHICTSIMAYHE